MSNAITVLDQPVTTPSTCGLPSGPLPSGPLTFFHNRALIATRTPVPNSLRVAFVGDSMTYGAGLQFKESLAARVGVHLNGALPEVWVESLAFGSPGACAYHAVGRVITDALPIAPDIIVLCLCCNDAIMLAGQPDTADALGRTWLDFEPMLRTTLRTFGDVAARGHARALVLFHDLYRQMGDVCMPDLLGRLCAELGLPFVDGTQALKAYPLKDLVVSVADGHLNALGNDAIARSVAQFILGRQWTPASKGFADAGWIHAVERAAHARLEHGMPSALVYGDALAVLDTKWMHRRNTSRRQLEPEYAAVRERLLEAHRASLSALVGAACGRTLRTEYPLHSLNPAERITNEAMAASFALDHVVASGGSDVVLEHLGHLRAGDVASPPDPEASRAGWERARDSVAEIRLALSQVDARTPHAHDDSPDRQFIVFWASRVAQWCHTVERCSQRYVDLLPRLPEASIADLAGLIAYADCRARAIAGMAERLRPAVKRVISMQRGAANLAGTGSLVLELVISASSGPGVWGVNVGIESHVPAFAEGHLSCFNIIRDGQPHAYRVDIPLMLVGDVHLLLFGPGVSAADHELKIYTSSRLCWTNGETAVPLPPFAVRQKYPDTIALVSQSAQSLPLLD